jgi:non-specific serine/threonine protein kinase
VSAPYHNKALPEGTILREWRLEEVLGVGGFGIVYRGKDVHFGESVAIKEYFPGAISDRVDGMTVTPTDSSSEEIYQLGRQKFMEEAKLLWNLSHPERHPNIVSVRSLFEIHGTAYMVMDFESGVSLSQMLREGKKFDEQGLLAIIRPIADGLERAHKVGVLHRDIKPANILVSPEGRPVLIDFGSARFESSNATNTKVTFYTPPYAAIEQYVKSYPQGPWTDIYALGVVLYQCITGEKPPEVLERMHGEDNHALSDRGWPGFSKTFTRAVDAAMAIRPLERPANLSAWLKMFEVKEPAPVEEATRVATVAPSISAAPPPPPPPEPPKVVSVAVPPPPESATMAEKVIAASIPEDGTRQPPAAESTPPLAAPAKKPTGKFALIVLGAAAVFAILAAAGLVVSRWHKNAAPAPAPAAIVAAEPAQTSQTLAAKMDAVIDAARKAGRKDNEVTALTDAKTKLTSLVASKADAAQQASAAADTAKTETDILSRAEKRLWRDVETPAPDAPSGPEVTKLQQSKSDLDAKLTAAPSQDAGQILEGLRLSLASFGAFQDAYTAAMPAYVAARRKSFDTLHTATQTLCDQITALANVDKPWFLASSARKDAYKLRQDNAAQAKTLSARLNDLGKTIDVSNDLHQVSAAVSEATTAKKTASGLYAASNAAQL